MLDDRRADTATSMGEDSSTSSTGGSGRTRLSLLWRGSLRSATLLTQPILPSPGRTRGSAPRHSRRPAYDVVALRSQSHKTPGVLGVNAWTVAHSLARGAVVRILPIMPVVIIDAPRCRFTNATDVVRVAARGKSFVVCVATATGRVLYFGCCCLPKAENRAIFTIGRARRSPTPDSVYAGRRWIVAN